MPLKSNDDLFSSGTEGHSLTDPLLPLQEDQDDNNEQEFSHSPLNEDSAAGYFYRYEHYDGDLRNVRRILSATWFGFVGRAIWSPNILSILMYLLYPHRPERVGYITAAMGLCQVLSTTMTRCCLSPIWKRHQLLRLAAFIGMGAIGAIAYALLVKEEWFWLVGGFSAWGFMWGMTDVAMPSLFADSLPEDDEPLYYTRASRVIRSSNALGPLIAIVLFHFYLGDHWTIHNCTIVTTVGLGFCLAMLLLLCCLREVNIEEEQVDFPDEIHLRDMPLDSDEVQKSSKLDLSAAAGDNSGNVTEDTAAITALLDSSQDTEREDPTVCGCCLQSNAVPALISVANMLSGIASGISIRYFPVFFVNQLHLSPIFVQVLYLVTPLGQAIVNFISRRLARLCGASLITVLLQWTFVAVLGSMLFCYEKGMSVWIVVGLYLGHAFLMNSTTALTQSILWSTVPDDKISKWTIAETLQLLLWSLGAGAGGYLVKTRGFLVCFAATATLQLLASVPVIFLCCVGPSRQRVNAILFPGTPTYSYGDRPISSFNDPDDSSDGTRFEDTHEILDSSDDDTSSGVYFDCNYSLEGESAAAMGMVAHYDRVTRCCVYEDGSPAHIPAGTSTQTLPSNFLRICKGNHRKAAKQWNATQEWRKKGQVWKIHTVPNHWYLRIKDAYPHSIHGFTKDGYPVIYEQPGNMKLKWLFRDGCTVSDMTRWYTFFMEYLSNCMTARAADEESLAHDWGFVVVMDMRRAGISMLSSDVLSYLKQAGAINNTHYPLSMKQSYLINAGSLVASIWSGVRKTLPESVHVEIFKSPSPLRNYIDEDQIPSEYGGTSPYPLGHHPDELALRSIVENLSVHENN